MASDDQLCVLELDTGVRSKEDRRAERVAAALGWAGLVVPDLRLLGQRITVVAELDHAAHAERTRNGQRPVVDRMAVELWQWPEVAAPARAVRLVGIMAEGTRWQRVMSAAGGFVGFGATAIVLLQQHQPNPHCLITAQLHGIGVVRAGSAKDDVTLVQAGRPGPIPTARESTVSRWLEELVYDRLIGAAASQ